MWGVLLVLSSSPTLSPIYDGLDVNVTSNVTCFHLNHDIVSRRIYKLSFFYEGHSITPIRNSIHLKPFVPKTSHFRPTIQIQVIPGHYAGVPPEGRAEGVLGSRRQRFVLFFSPPMHTS